MRELSTRAWQRAYSYKGVVRPNTFYQDIEEIVGKKPGHLIASTACLGGRLAHLVAAGDTQGVIGFCAWCRKQFGEENFFIEMQCGVTPEQIDFNQRILLLLQDPSTTRGLFPTMFIICQRISANCTKPSLIPAQRMKLPAGRWGSFTKAPISKLRKK